MDLKLFCLYICCFNANIHIKISNFSKQYGIQQLKFSGPERKKELLKLITLFIYILYTKFEA